MSLYNDDVHIPDLHFATTEDGGSRRIVDGHAVDMSCAVVPGAVAACLTVGGEELGAPLTRLGEGLWRWQWQPRGRAGVFAVRLVVRFANGAEAAREWPLHVAPGKLEQEHYTALLAAIQRLAAGLVYALDGGGTPSALEAGADGPASLVEEYWTRLQYQAARAVAATRVLAGTAHVAWNAMQSDRELSELREPGEATLVRAIEGPLDEVALHPGAPLLDVFPGTPGGIARLPRSVPVVAFGRTANVYEHRLLARILDALLAQCIFVRQSLAREVVWRRTGAEGDTAIAALQAWQTRANAVARALRQARAAAFLAEVEPATEWHGTTELMRRDRRYREIGRLWRLLGERPFVAALSPAFDLPVDDLPSIYEQWCLLDVARAIMRFGTLVDQQLFVSEHSRGPERAAPAWRVAVAEDRPLVQRRCADGTELLLLYRRRFRAHAGHGDQLGSLDPFLRIPDIVVEVRRPGAVPAVLVFDAKYRVAPNGGIPEEALATAYAYRGAIGYAGETAALGVFLLFPGADGFESGGVGALPLLPGQTDVLDDTIGRLLAVYGGSSPADVVNGDR